MKIRVDAGHAMGPFPHFWQSTGFTPAKLLSTPVMKQTLAYVGGVPHGGITHVRIHFLLDLVKAKNLGTDRPIYDWTQLDAGVDELVHNGLRPFFELMGNVSGWFNDFKEPMQAYAWKRLVRDLAVHCMARYGGREVESWYFETWNEPDVGWWKQDMEAFLIYYDACSEGLKEASARLRFGGPGTAKHLSEPFKMLLAHCDSGKNFFTGETGVRMDFLSVHDKGRWWFKEDVTPSASRMVDNTGAAAAYVRKHHPRLASVPVVNDESDPIVGWSEIHTWHARPYYAAFSARLIAKYLYELQDKGTPFELLGNDNGFPGTWGQRTLMTTIAEGGQGSPVEADAQGFENVKKPILNLMEMLSLLGDTRLTVVGGNSEPIHALATRRGGQVAVLVSNSVDATHKSGVQRVTLDVGGLEGREYCLVRYRIDDDRKHPFTVFDERDMSRDNRAERIAAMRACQELTMHGEPVTVKPKRGHVSASFRLPLPGVALVLLTPRPAKAPGRAGGLSFSRWEGLSDRENILLKWNGLPCRTIRTYEVLYAPRAGAPFQRINQPDLIGTVFMHVREPNPDGGLYRVRAVDYWGRAGEASAALKALKRGSV